MLQDQINDWDSAIRTKGSDDEKVYSEGNPGPASLEFFHWGRGIKEE